MPTISRKRITCPEQFGGDGLGLADGRVWTMPCAAWDMRTRLGTKATRMRNTAP